MFNYIKIKCKTFRSTSIFVHDKFPHKSACYTSAPRDMWTREMLTNRIVCLYNDLQYYRLCSAISLYEMLRSLCTAARTFPRKEITARFLAWVRRLKRLWSNPRARKVIYPCTLYSTIHISTVSRTTNVWLLRQQKETLCSFSLIWQTKVFQ